MKNAVTQINCKAERDSSEITIGTLNKGLGTMTGNLTAGEIVKLNWNLLKEDISLPTAVLYEERLQHNLEWMQQFITTYGVKLAPHGKTTMAPRLFARQLQTGAWGITLATAQQTHVAYTHGVRRVLMANQLVGKQNMQVIADLLHDPTFEYFCLVDSVQQVEQLGRFFQVRQQKLNVLVELGVAGGRAGVRDEESLQRLLLALTQWRASLKVCGVEIYEGVLDQEPSIRTFLHRAADVASRMAQSYRFDRDPVILSGAGSAWYDVVADVFSTVDLGCSVDIVLRPGCYLTHDVGVYHDAQQKILVRNPVARKMRCGLLPTLQLWAYVQSIPEATNAILTLGKRDAAFDAGLPTPVLHYRPGSRAPQPCISTWSLTRMMDQHAYMAISPGDDLQVGDMIGLDISHPCLTFDKWRYLPILNADFQVIDIVETFF